MAEAWLLNPKRIGRKRQKRSRPKLKKGGMVMANPKRRRKRRARPRRGFALFGNAPKRRARRRRYRANPASKRRRFRRNPPPMGAIMNELVSASVGFMSTKFVGNMVAPMLGALGTQPIMRMLTKLGVAYATAWGAEMMMGKRWFMPVMVGGSIEVIQDGVRTFISPYVPALAAAEYPLEVYYEPAALPPPRGGVGAYEYSPDVGAYMQLT